MTTEALKLYDALDAAKGDPKQMARAIADFVHEDSNLATKADLALLRADLHQELREHTWKMAGLLIAQSAAIVALIKLLP
jgi:hypothetical protein